MAHEQSDELLGYESLKTKMNPFELFSIYKPVGNELFGHGTIKQIVLIMTRFSKVKFKRYNETIINQLKWDSY